MARKKPSFGSLRGQLQRRTGERATARRARVKRRKLEKAEPGTVIILEAKRKTRRSAAGAFEARRRGLGKELGVRTRGRKVAREGVNAFSVEFGTLMDWGMDLDVRKLLRDYIQIPLAIHFRDQLFAGRRPTSNVKLPEINESTARHWKRSRGGYGVRTGWMARNWLIFPVIGGPFKARCILKPNGSDGRNVMIKWALRHGIDFQGVTGSAARVIEEGFQAWVRDMMSVRGGVATPKKVDHLKKGTLAQFV